jgi:hypothetical protein
MRNGPKTHGILWNAVLRRRTDVVERTGRLQSRGNTRTAISPPRGSLLRCALPTLLTLFLSIVGDSQKCGAVTVKASSEVRDSFARAIVPPDLGPSPDWGAYDTRIASVDGWKAITWDAMSLALRALEECGGHTYISHVLFKNPDCSATRLAESGSYDGEFLSWACDRIRIRAQVSSVQRLANVAALGVSESTRLFEPWRHKAYPRDAPGWCCGDRRYRPEGTYWDQTGVSVVDMENEGVVPGRYCLRTTFRLRITVFPAVFEQGELYIPSEDTILSNGRVVVGRWATTPTEAMIYVLLHEIGHFETYVGRALGAESGVLGISEEDAWAFATSVAFCRDRKGGEHSGVRRFR